jgi:branched-chain amino acid aminotransferase
VDKVRRVEQLAILDGVVQPADEARIPVTDEGFLRGDGVFEVARLYAGRPFAWEDHLRRMTTSAQNLRLPFNAEQIDDDVRTLLDAAGPVDAALRVVVTRGGHRLALIEPVKDHAASIALATVTYSPTRVLDAVKSLSYAGNMLAGRLAQEQGADEALLVTPHGRVLEAPTSSFFYTLADDQHLYTPPLEDHILDSITRRRVAAMTGAIERVTARDDLQAIGEAFLASTLREVQAVHAIDGRWLADTPGPRTREAADLFRAQVEGETTST